MPLASSLSVRQIARLYKNGKLSPVEVTKTCLKQIATHDPILNAICWLDEPFALRQARASEKRWREGQQRSPIDGIPTTIKDWFDVKGWPTRYGSLLSSSAPQTADSLPVLRLREAGAILLAKTTLPEFAHKGVTDSALRGITRNPWNSGKTSGGSSGGAAVAAASGMAPLNLGSDAGGSIRIPASFCGVFGFKPSPNLVPTWPASAFSSFSAIGPLTRSVEDAALMMDVLAQPDARDWNALPFPPPRFFVALRKPLPRLKIAVASSINGLSATKEVRAVFKAALQNLSLLGDVEEIKLYCPKLVEVFNRHWSAVASWHIAHIPQEKRMQIDARYQEWARKGDTLSLHQYIDAGKDRMEVGAYFKAILDRYDILITPTTPMTAFDAGQDMPYGAKGRKWPDWTPFTYPANLAKLPAASVPIGLAKDGLPVGLQIMSGYWKDALLMRVAHAAFTQVKNCGG